MTEDTSEGIRRAEFLQRELAKARGNDGCCGETKITPKDPLADLFLISGNKHLLEHEEEPSNPLD